MPRLKTFLKRMLKSPELYFAIAIAVLGLVLVSNKVVAKNVVFETKGTSKNTVFPIMGNMDQGQEFSVSFDIVSSSDYELRAVPDDCVKQLIANGNVVDLHGMEGLCDYHKGFVLRKEQFYRQGKDHFEFYIKNGGGPGGLNIRVLQQSKLWLQIAEGLFYGLIAALCLVLLRRFGVGIVPAVILTLGVALRMYFSISLPDHNMYGHDTDGHISYVQYIVDNKSLPGKDDCWTCYHPPVYFAAMAPLWAFSTNLNMSGASLLQVADVVMSIFVLVFGFLVLREFLSGPLLYLSTFMWSFWPMVILSASRIGNDSLFYMLHILCLWGGLKYIRTCRGRYILVAAIASFFAYWTKTTGAISIAICGLSLVLGYGFSRNSLKPTKSEILSLLFMLAAVGGALYSFIGKSDGLVGNNGGLHGGLRVGKDFVNFMYIDIQQFLAHPFTSPWDDNLGRQYFWNYMMKTSLFGEFTWIRSDVGLRVAQTVNVSFLLLVVYALRGFWKESVGRQKILLIAQGVALAAALAFMRYKYPYACSNDFRYVMPLLLTLIPYMAFGVKASGSSFRWKLLGCLLMFVFTVSSIALLLMTAATFN